MYTSPYDRFILTVTTFVAMKDIRPFTVDSNSLSEAVSVFLRTKEEKWLDENPSPREARLYQGWFFSKLKALFPDYSFIVDGLEMNSEQAKQINPSTWNIKIQISYDEELSLAMEKEEMKNAGR